jgi:uncharacterized membrane protein
MSTLDVSVDIDIAAAPADVAAVMFDAARDAEWMKAVTAVDVLDPALKPGARVRRTATFLGRDISWVTEVEMVHFPHLLALRIADGPFVGTVRYEIQRTATGSRARIHNVGEPGQLGALVPASFIAAPMRSALAGDLERLKAIVEQAAVGTTGPVSPASAAPRR